MPSMLFLINNKKFFRRTQPQQTNGSLLQRANWWSVCYQDLSVYKNTIEMTRF